MDRGVGEGLGRGSGKVGEGVWRDTKEYLNQRGTKIRVFRV